MENLMRPVSDPKRRVRPVPAGTIFPFSLDEREGSVPERFSQVVRTYPDRPAIKFDNHIYTYEMLDRASNRVALAILSQLGHGAEPVALLLQNGITLTVAILGILKAGKGYASLYPASPPSKLASILEDLQTGLILADQEHFPLATELAQNGCQIMNIGEIGDRFSDGEINVSLSPDSLGAIFYTSGSTGRPKGVEQSHRVLLHYAWRNSNIEQNCIEDHHSSLFFHGFAMSASDIFSTLLSGATLYPYDPQSAGLEQLINWLIQEGITLLYLPIPLFRQLADNVSKEESFPQLRMVRPMGQTMYTEDVERFRKHFPADCILVNGFGSTEAGSISRFYIDHETKISGTTVPIGYAIQDKEILLLDDAGQEVGFDSVGEIVIKSRYLATGYWRNPELTRKAFLPDPEGSDKRLYYTGDLGRMKPDGCLEFLGRSDFQVKVRGYRVELEEVEAVLSRHPAVQETAVIAYEDDSGDNSLAAYIVINQEQETTISELNRFMKEKLPEYMIPSHFVMLDEMPLTSNGKVNRQALPKLEAVRPELEEDFVPPRDDLEIRLTRIWEDIIGIEPVGVKDNFFDLGGHSLHIMSLFTQIQRMFDRNLSPSTLLQSPTVEQLASILRHERAEESSSSLVAIQPDGSRQPLFCIHACDGEVLIYRKLSLYLGPEQPFYGLRAMGLDEGRLVHHRIEDMAAHYIREIRAAQSEGPYLLGGMGVGGRIAFEMAQQLVAQNEEMSLLVLMDSVPPRLKRPGLRYYLRRLAYNAKHRQLTKALLRKVRKGSFENLTSQQGFGLISDAITRISVRYKPQAYSGRIVYFQAEDRRGLANEPLQGVGAWRELAVGELDVRVVSGDHFRILKEPHVQVLAQQLRECLDAAQANDSGA